VKDGGVAVLMDVAVRHTPLMAMLSPSWASERRVDEAGSVMVSEVPPVASWELSSETSVWVDLAADQQIKTSPTTWWKGNSGGPNLLSLLPGR
jgi:hypothetical protein